MTDTATMPVSKDSSPSSPKEDPETTKPVTALVGGIRMTADQWGQSLVASAEQQAEDLVNKTKYGDSEPMKNHAAMGWALADLTEEEEIEQQRFQNAVMARIHGETAAAIAAEKTEKRKNTDVVSDADGPQKKTMRAGV